MIQKDSSDFDENIVQNTINEQNFECLYKSYWKKVFGIVYHYTEDKEISAELTQELFATLWEKRASLVFQKDIKAYLFRAAKLEAFDYIRTSVRRKQLLENFPPAYSQNQNSTEDALMYNELRNRLDTLIGRLPHRCQEVYSLSQNDGLNNSTIAGMLSISEKTVEYHLYKTMSFLRESLSLEKA
ncbi:RNA polymerase sigma-70 factor [Pedobacter nototheniae]|uniref:RNA polymerase sigma-70 factor n=1 Tax=Pedobacter nototheniae TaxID=2488994 RepID=UPI00292F6521|nr:RNA polymerase sigma-70 factor [Pedobacter nototheniae]